MYTRYLTVHVQQHVHTCINICIYIHISSLQNSTRYLDWNSIALVHIIHLLCLCVLCRARTARHGLSCNFKHK